MPEERDIEKQLRAAAAQRRKDAGGKFELHPATRRLLQGEAAHAHGQKNAAPRRAFWPRFAWAVSMLTALAVGIWSLSPAKKIPHPQPASTQPEPAPAAVARAPIAPDSRAAKLEMKDFSAASRVEIPQPAFTTSRAIAASAASREKEFGAAKVQEKSLDAITIAPAAAKSVAINPPAAQPPEMAQQQVLNFSNAGALADASVTGLLFANSVKKPSGAKNSSASANVLNNFQFEQNGSQIRIVDKDGSIYEGGLVADGAKPGAAPVIESAAAAQNVNASLAQNFRFAAAGTNRSLRQRVLINGEFQAAVNRTIGGQSAANAQLQSAIRDGSLISNARVVGSAVTADGQAVDLDAAQVLQK